MRKQQAAAAKTAKKSKTPVVSEDAEAREMAKMMLSNKHRKLYNRMGHSFGKRNEEKQLLEAKKKKLRKGKQ